jgi:hypothetical protein
MVVLLLLLGFIALAAGMFGLGLGIPVKESTFGAAVLVSASVAITGGLILLGIAAAVSELRRVLQAGLRQMRLPERHEAERDARRMEPRLGGVPGAPGGAVKGAAVADAADVVAARFVRPEERPRRPAREERLRSDAANLRGPAVPPPPPKGNAAPGPLSGTEQRRDPAPDRFDAIRPADYRKPDKPDAAAPELQAAAPAAGTGAGEVNAPPLAPAEAAPPAAGPAAVKPVRILKSGKINDVAYTLFSDGSIETQTPSATLRFSSIDEFRKHLERTA